MNTQTRSKFSGVRAKTLVLNFGKKALACSLAYLMIPLGMGDIYAFAQVAPPPPPDQQQYDQQQYEDQGPPPESYNTLSPDQLDQLVAPIALYPDSLVAQILAASTYPDQIADADQFLQANQGAPPDQLGDMVNNMDWDPSVKALVAFPSILDNLNRNLDWTSQLGNAYYNQPQDVMSAVQDMRQRAYEAGNLRPTPQLAVQYTPGDIIIAPANPEVVYVPWYDPWTIYGAPIAPWGGYYVRPRPAGLFFAAGFGLGFGVGIAIGHWNNWGWGWHNWGMGWRNRTIVYNRNIYISRSTRVRNHGYYGRFDRNPSARNYNRTVEVRGRNNPALTRNNNFNRNNRNNYRPNNNVRQNQNFNRNNNRPNNNQRIAPFNNRPNNNANRPNNTVRQNPNYNRNTVRPNYNNERQNPNYNRNTVRPNYNNERQNPNYNRNTVRPNNNVRQNPNFNRPEARPQAQPEARPQPRPQPQQRQARPQSQPEGRQQARPEGRSNNGDHGHEKSHR